MTLWESRGQVSSVSGRCGPHQGQQVDGGLQVSDLQVLGVQQPEQGAAHTVDLVRHAGKSLSSQTHRLLNRLRCVLSLDGCIYGFTVVKCNEVHLSSNTLIQFSSMSVCIVWYS